MLNLIFVFTAIVDVSRFTAPGVMFKAKLIGIQMVPEARGDKMCQESMARLKGLVRSTGEHKQRIIINVALQGVKILDERSGVSLLLFYFVLISLHNRSNKLVCPVSIFFKYMEFF